MKKYLLLLIVFLFPMMTFADEIESNHLQNVTKEESTALTVEKLKEISISEGMSGAQGMDVTDKYIVITQNPSSNEGSTNNAILVYDKNTLELVKTITHNVGHGNDVCYNSDTKEIIIVKSGSGKFTFVIFDADTLEHKKDVDISTDIVTSGHAVTYNPSKKQYMIASGDVGYILDKDLKLISKFDIKIDQVKQSFEYHGGYLYYSCYENLNASYTRKFEVFTGVIFVFDSTGKYLNTLYIPRIGNDTVELEGVSVDTDGTTYFLYNNHTTHKIIIYKASFSKNSSVEVKIPVKIEDLAQTTEKKYSYACIYSLEGETADGESSAGKIMMDGGNPAEFSIPINLTDVGTKIYYASQVKADSKAGSDSEMFIDDEPIKITITSRYVLAKNKVVSSYKLDRTQFVNHVTADPPTVIDNVPDTTKGHSILYIIIGVFVGIIGGLIVYSTREKKVEL